MTGYSSDVSPTVLRFDINEDLRVLSLWFQNNYLKINEIKTQAIIVGPSYEYEFLLNSREVNISDTLRSLAFHLIECLLIKTI